MNFYIKLKVVKKRNLLQKSDFINFRIRNQPFEMSKYLVECPPPVCRILQLIFHLGYLLCLDSLSTHMN